MTQFFLQLHASILIKQLIGHIPVVWHEIDVCLSRQGRQFDYCIIQSYRILMCFFKSLQIGNAPSFEPCQLNCHQLTQPLMPLFPIFHNPLATFHPTSNTIPPQSFYNVPSLAYLCDICTRIQANNQNLEVFEEKLTKNQKILQKADEQILQILQKDQKMAFPQVSETLSLGNRKKTLQHHSPLLTKIFGARTYRYRLRLKVQFPRVIYKERRLNLAVRLVTQENVLVRNANLLHLCLAACDSTGHWMVGNDDGSFILGRTQVDFYKGQAEFLKVYPVDISRHCPGGKIVLIIYPKPSLLNLTGGVEKGEAVISHEEIEPLCIENVLVKAKKRQRY